MTCSLCDQPVRCKGLCRLHYMREYKAANRDRLREMERERVSAIPGYQVERYARNREARLAANRDYYQRNRDARIAYSKQWCAANPELARAIGAARQARRREAERRATPAWADQLAILAVYKEAARLSAATGVSHDVDHIVPLQAKNVCGLHVHWNLQPLPASANRSKQNNWDEAEVVRRRA